MTWLLATSSAAQTSAFTYQGRLSDAGNPAAGLHDFEFKLFDAANAGAQQGTTVVAEDVVVAGGLFTVTLDFGAGVFNGGGRWLEIAVRPGVETGAYTGLSPRQAVTASPYAVKAANANTVEGGSIRNPAFIGTTGNTPLQLFVNDQRVLRLEPNPQSPNLLGGHPVNNIGAGVVGAVVAGGGADGYDGGGLMPNSVLADFGVVSGGFANTIAAGSLASTVAGGINNRITGSWSCFIGSGVGNRIEDSGGSVISGGEENQVLPLASVSTIGGGSNNLILSKALYGAVGGGRYNRIGADSFAATVAGGAGNISGTNADFSTIGGGGSNHIEAGAMYATIPGGDGNAAAASHTFAAGRRAIAEHTGAFVWADSTDATFTSTAANQFAVRAGGGFFLDGRLGVGTNTPGWPLDVQNVQAVGRFTTTDSSNGAVLVLRNTTPAPVYLGAINFEDSGTHGQIGYLASHQMTFRVGGLDRMNLQAGGLTVNGTFVSSSDRNEKENFAPTNVRAVLEKVVALPVSEWNYKTDTGTRHLGPMAQDFYAAFNVGPDDKHIATVDADGVALAAIKGLNEKVEGLSGKAANRIQKLEAENAELKARLERLEELLTARAAK